MCYIVNRISIIPYRQNMKGEIVMKRKFSGFLSGFICACLLIGITFGAAAASQMFTIEVSPINIKVNGEVFKPANANGDPVEVFAHNGTTYVPLRALSETYGFNVGYDEKENLAYVNDEPSSGAYNVYEGYISIKDGQLLVNDFEFIDKADQYWIDKLGLTDEDMLDGYYIYDVSDELMSLSLSGKVRYNFYDVGAQFVPEDNADRLYTTTSLKEFLQKFAVDTDGNLLKTPFTIEAFEDGRVISISEIFIS